MSNFSGDAGTGMDEEKEARLMRQGRRIFMKEFQKQLDQLQALLERIEKKPTDEELGQLYRIFHSLKGSAPIFGYACIGLLAEELVEKWEWTQSIPAVDVDSDSAVMEEKLIFSTQSAVHRLIMEYDIGVTELNMEEHNVHSTAFMLGNMQCRLLIVHGEDALSSYLERRLQLDGCQVDEVSDTESAKRMLHEQTYDLILLELESHPHADDGLFEYVKEDPTLKWIPLIVFSGKNDVNDKLRCFQLGADDYLVKPFQYEELAARMYGLLKRTRNLEQLAFRDPLTGVSNRRYFDLQIGLEVRRAERNAVPIAIAFIDIDKFKSINDTYGHPVGDLVLQGVAHLLQTNLRSTDLLARFGGEEFVIVLPNSSEEQGIQAVQAILDQANQQPVAQQDGQTFSITFSAGVAQLQPGMRVEEWLRIADTAMYAAKRQGRNRVLGAEQRLPQLGFKKTNSSPQYVRKRLLLVGEDIISRSILFARLELLPIEIVQSSDGEDAFQIMRKEQFDVCVLDGVMPNADGLSLLAVLESDQEFVNRDMKIFMLSGKKNEDELVKRLQLGMHDYMTKPFSVVELEMRVRRMLKI